MLAHLRNGDTYSRLAHNGYALGILDGTLVRIDRLGGELDRLYYSASTATTG